MARRLLNNPHFSQGLFMKFLLSAFVFTLLISCGKDSPFDPKYYNKEDKPASNSTSTTESQTAEAPVEGEKFTIELRATNVAANLFKSGNAALSMDATNAKISISFDDIQNNVIIGDVRLENRECGTIAMTPFALDQYKKNINYSDTGAIVALFPGFPSNPNYSAFRLVVYMNLKGQTGLQPVACGELKQTR